MRRPGLGRAFVIAGAVCLAATLLIGCQSGPTGSGPTGTATAGPTGATTGTPAPPSTPGPSPAAILAAAMAPLASASEFDSAVTVDGVVATSLTGRSVGNATVLVVTTSGRTVEYIRVPPKAWAREPGATWLIVDSAQTPTSPLAALAAPISVEAVPGTSVTTLKATYTAAVLGLEGDPVTVTVTVEGDTTTFRYELTSKGRVVASTTVLRPATDTTPIVAPKV